MTRRPQISPFFPSTPLFRFVESSVRPDSGGEKRPLSAPAPSDRTPRSRSEEHTSELQSHSFISYAVFCLNDTAPPDFSLFPLHAAFPICGIERQARFWRREKPSFGPRPIR